MTARMNEMAGAFRKEAAHETETLRDDDFIVRGNARAVHLRKRREFESHGIYISRIRKNL